MSKVFFKPQVDSKKRVAVRMPKKMLSDSQKILLETGKTTREFSSWVSEAIEELFILENYWEIIAEEWLDKGENMSRPVTLTVQAYECLLKMNAMYRCKNQGSVEVNSKIIRTAITQKLIREEAAMLGN